MSQDTSEHDTSEHDTSEHDQVTQTGLYPSAPVQPAAGMPLFVSQGSLLSLAADKQFEPLITRLEADLESARRQGVWGVLRLRYEAWLEERLRGPAIQKMQTRQVILAEQCRTAEAEIRLRATVQSGEVGAQRHKIEWNEVNRHRLAGELQALGLIAGPSGPDLLAAPAAPGASPPPLSAHVSQDQVEAVALRGFLQGVETEDDWAGFKAELGHHLSPYAVEEVGQRLRELWRLNRQAQAGQGSYPAA